jgi:uncharacterized protein YbjT (DUF2867 family)
MNLLILGAAGGTGRALVAQAVAQGHVVTAWTHHPPDPSLPSPVHLIVADIRDIARLDAAIANQDAVVDALGTRRPFLTTTLETDAATAVIASMHRHNIPRLIAISSLGVGDSIQNINFVFRLLLPLFFRGVMPDKQRMEAAVRSSHLDWMIVRSAGLTNGPATGNVQIITPQSRRHVRRISRADVAAFILQQLASPLPLQKVVGIATS